MAVNGQPKKLEEEQVQHGLFPDPCPTCGEIATMVFQRSVSVPQSILTVAPSGGPTAVEMKRRGIRQILRCQVCGRGEVKEPDDSRMWQTVRIIEAWGTLQDAE